MSPRILIVGGGLAGLAAAVALTDRGFPCQLIESRPRLGGRASSFHDPTTGTEIDNCQHVTLGCCTNFRHFCETTGLAHYFHREPELYFAGPDGKINPFGSGGLPAPLHLTGAFAKLSYLTWSDKLALAKGLKALAKPVNDADEAEPFSVWLKRHHQPDTVVQRFWFVVLVSALSESLDRISVKHARKVFVDAFLAHRDGWYVDIPTVPLERLYGGELTNWLTSRGTNIRTLTSAEELLLEGDRVAGIRTAAKETIPADEVVVALPFFRVRSIVPDALANRPEFADAEKLEAAPISSVHLWFDRPIMSLRHAVLVDKVSQWVFNRTLIGTGHATEVALPNSHYYQVVISASHDLKGQTKDSIEKLVVSELAAVWPEAAEANVLHSRHVTEHRAVFSPVPTIDQLRPLQQSSISNLQLAGDWTQTGWPATMEGAVRSGYLAAENVLRRLGRDEKVLQPNLPTAPLSRLLFGL